MISKIPHLRQIIANGWTMANRKDVARRIESRSISEELSELSLKVGLGMDVFQYSQAKSHLTKTEVPLIKRALLKRLNSKNIDVLCAKEGFLSRNKPGSASICSSWKDDGDWAAFETMPTEYLTTTKSPAVDVLKPHFYIYRLYSDEAGFGATCIKRIVEESLKDKETEGRVLLQCVCIDKNRKCGAGFYYKLGFRFADEHVNEIFDKWLSRGGEREKAPIKYGYMYLPKENIINCLTYGK